MFVPRIQPNPSDTCRDAVYVLGRNEANYSMTLKNVFESCLAQPGPYVVPTFFWRSRFKWNDTLYDWHSDRLTLQFLDDPLRPQYQPRYPDEPSPLCRKAIRALFLTSPPSKREFWPWTKERYYVNMLKFYEACLQDEQ